MRWSNLCQTELSLRATLRVVLASKKNTSFCEIICAFKRLAPQPGASKYAAPTAHHSSSRRACHNNHEPARWNSTGGQSAQTFLHEERLTPLPLLLICATSCLGAWGPPSCTWLQACNGSPTCVSPANVRGCSMAAFAASSSIERNKEGRRRTRVKLRTTSQVAHWTCVCGLACLDSFSAKPRRGRETCNPAKWSMRIAACRQEPYTSTPGPQRSSAPAATRILLTRKRQRDAPSAQPQHRHPTHNAANPLGRRCVPAP